MAWQWGCGKPSIIIMERNKKMWAKQNHFPFPFCNKNHPHKEPPYQRRSTFLTVCVWVCVGGCHREMTALRHLQLMPLCPRGFGLTCGWFWEPLPRGITFFCIIFDFIRQCETIGATILGHIVNFGTNVVQMLCLKCLGISKENICRKLGQTKLLFSTHSRIFIKLTVLFYFKI